MGPDQEEREIKRNGGKGSEFVHVCARVQGAVWTGVGRWQWWQLWWRAPNPPPPESPSSSTALYPHSLANSGPSFRRVRGGGQHAEPPHITKS